MVIDNENIILYLCSLEVFQELNVHKHQNGLIIIEHYFQILYL